MAQEPKKIEPTGFKVGYARVSDREQHLHLQIKALREAGVKEDNLHVEKKSASRSKTRPALDLAIKDLREGDTLLVWRLDRFVRSVRELYVRLDQVYKKGAVFRSLTENFEFNTYIGQFILTILAAVAELEVRITGHRTSAGIEAWRARQKGGGKWGREVIMTPEKIAEAGRLLNRKRDPLTGPEAAEQLGVSTASIYAFWRKGRGGRFVRKQPGDRGKARAKPRG